MDKENRNGLIYLLTITVIIIVYLVIYLFGIVISKNIYDGIDDYQNTLPKQPVNNIIAIHRDNNDNNGKNNNSHHNNQGNNQNNNQNDDITNDVFMYDYDEENYIDINNQFPTRDEVGMNFVGDKCTHDFKIKVSSKALGYRYTITLKKQLDSSLEDKWTKVYLTSNNSKISNCFRSNGRIKTYNEYANYLDNSNEKILYMGIVTNDDIIKGYREFTLRMWVSEDLTVYNEAYLKRFFKANITVYAEE